MIGQTSCVNKFSVRKHANPLHVIVIPWLRGILLIYTPKAQGLRVYVSKIPSSRGISDIYHLGHTHLIGERTNENSSHLFYTVASEDRSWF